MVRFYPSRTGRRMALARPRGLIYAFRKVARVLLIIGLVSSCAKSPVSPVGGVTVTTPGVASPANGAQVPNAAQPVTLVVTNAFVTSAPDSVNYTFEVASDAAFTSNVQSKDVPQGSSQTTLKLDAWRLAGTTTGGFARRVKTRSGWYTPAMKFTIGAAVTLQAPAAVAPDASAVTTPQPTLTVANAARTDRLERLPDRFEDRDDGRRLERSSLQAQCRKAAVKHRFTPPSDLPQESNLFWRAQAIDAANGVTSPFSAARAFKTTVTINLNTVNYQRFVKIATGP